jgi:hypothetical protein
MQHSHEHYERGLNGLKRYLISVAASITVAIVCQTGALLWWAGAITARVECMEKNVDAISVRVHQMETAHEPHS